MLIATKLKLDGITWWKSTACVCILQIYVCILNEYVPGKAKHWMDSSNGLETIRRSQ